MKISFITTVFNEEKTVDTFLKSLLLQTKLPDEVVIVDGGSTDFTVSKLNSYEPKFKKRKIKFTVLIKKGNRSVGRNEAISKTTGQVIVCSDSGNILDINWIRNITAPFKDKKIDVVAGYYKGLAKNIFQKCLIPFVLVMKDQVDPSRFLPATRSIAFKKSIWEKAGGFPEQFSHNEDYVFAKKLEKIKTNIIFAENAIVYWIPRNTFKEAFIMFFRFALGDAESKMWREKVLLLFARYFIGLYLCGLVLLYRSWVNLLIVFSLLFFYVVWTIAKNYKYIKDKKAFVVLPLLQFTADFAVIGGSTVGLLKRMTRLSLIKVFQKNIFFFFCIFVYIFLLSLTISWGIPNFYHPFPYQMDEWHQLQAVANTFRYGTPNTAGSANGTMFHFLLSGVYLVPFTLLNYINPFALEIDNFIMRERMFEILRINTIIWGILSITVLYIISKLLKLSYKFVLPLFIFTPIWLMLSGYFKYDISLMFWILLSILYFVKFANNPTTQNFLLTAVATSLAIAVKVSAIPLWFLYNFSYFWFTPRDKWKLKSFILGNALFLILLLLFGFPDMIFGKGNIIDYLYNNLITTPSLTHNFLVSMNVFVYLFTVQYPSIFGFGLLGLFIFSLGYFVWIIVKNSFKNIKKFKIEIFLGISFISFLLSILPLKIYAGGNRSLVLLPFFVLLSALAIKYLSRRGVTKRLLTTVILIVLFFQFLQSYSWFSIKLAKNPQEVSSIWMEKNIPKHTEIGIENIPIYQFLPNRVEKEFYFNEYTVNTDNLYTYQIIDSTTKSLPEFIVITNEIEKKLLIVSPKKDLLLRIEKEGYKKIATFTPQMHLYNKLFTEEDFFIAGILTTPTSISIYQRSQSKEGEK